MDDLTILDFINDECAVLCMSCENYEYPIAGYLRDKDAVYRSPFLNDFKWVWEDKKIILCWSWRDEIEEKFEEIGHFDNLYIDLCDVFFGSDNLSSNVINALLCLFRNAGFDDESLSVQEHYREFSRFCLGLGFYISREIIDSKNVFYELTNCARALEKTRAVVFLLDYLCAYEKLEFESKLSTNDDLRCMFESYKIKKNIGLTDSEGTGNKKRRL